MMPGPYLWRTVHHLFKSVLHIEVSRYADLQPELPGHRYRRGKEYRYESRGQNSGPVARKSQALQMDIHRLSTFLDPQPLLEAVESQSAAKRP